MRRPALTALAALSAASALFTGCGSPSSPGGAASASPSGSITVFAAASLTESFTTLGHQFEAAHPGTKVTVSFGASSTLATQIIEGAPADVFASASQKIMSQVVTAEAASPPVPFAKNVAQVAVPANNPAHITGIADLARPGVKVAVCAPAVPCGVVARQVLSNARVTLTPVTEEPNVKAALAKVRLGEVDAGLVYVTDVKAAGSTVKAIPVPADVNASTTYPIATMTASKNTALAQEFVDYVLSGDGAAVLTAVGFEKP